MFLALALLALQQPTQQPPAIPPSPVARLVIQPTTRTVVAGDTLRLSAQAVDSAGRPVPNVVVRFMAQGARFEGVVDSFAPGSGSAFSLLPTDNATGNFVRVVQRVPVKIRFAGNPLSGRLLPGLSARVEIDLESVSWPSPPPRRAATYPWQGAFSSPA